MTELALILVLVSAVTHASWNFIAKRASAGPVFNWLFDLMAVGACLPFAIGLIVIQQPHLSSAAWVFVVVSAVLELAYFLLLGQGYRSGDLSLVYPLARGTGPMLATAAAVVLFGERPSPQALCGIALIGVGILALAGPRQLQAGNARRSVVFALLTGVLLAAYTLWDKQAVSPTGGAIPPLLYFFLFTTCRAAMLTPYALTRLPTVRSEWRLHRNHAFGVGVLCAVSYILVLYALAISPVSYVAPVREIGILFGAIMGWQLLAEGAGRRRVAGALAMVAGVVALAFG
ncbi:MAG: EamA family transporter [Chloroflexi bacterium]|nr:EamA family transporter [Chloroflexota bacterium]MBV9600212.1 EamA family transporter [Chloroflexota bacterium]